MKNRTSRVEQNRRTGVRNEKKHEHGEWIMKITKGVPYPRNVLTDNYTCSRGPSQIKFSMYNPVLLASGRRSKGDEKKKQKKNKRNERSFSRERHRRILRTHATLRAFLRSQKRLPGEVPQHHILTRHLACTFNRGEKKLPKTNLPTHPANFAPSPILRHVSLLRCVKCVCIFWTYV